MDKTKSIMPKTTNSSKATAKKLMAGKAESATTDRKVEKPKTFRRARLKKTVGVAAILNPMIKRSFGKRGFQNTAILIDWHIIVGVHLAKYSVPERIMYKRGERTKGILHVQVFGAMATELDHQAGLVVEKINQYMGYKAVSSLKLHHCQTIPNAKGIETVVKKYEEPKNVDESALARVMEDLEDSPIKDQLMRIGRHIFKNK